jgi:hypothetical protein
VTTWRVYIQEREMARVMNDPCLGQVEAATQEEALERAWKDAGVRSRMVPGAGLLVIEAEREERNRRLFSRDGGRGR